MLLKEDYIWPILKALYFDIPIGDCLYGQQLDSTLAKLIL